LIFFSADSSTKGRHFDVKGMHGDQNCVEPCHLLPIELVETAFKTFDIRQGLRSKHALKTVLSAMPSFCIKLPTYCAGVTGNGNSLKTRWRLNPEIKECPVPWSYTITIT